MSKLYFPEIKKISNVFSEAKLAEGMPPRRSGWFYLSGFCAHLGGERGIRVRPDNSFFCFTRKNAIFTSTWVRPLPGVVETAGETLISPPGVFELIRDLVVIKDDCGIGSRWVARLNEDETPLNIMDPIDRRFWEDEFKRDAEVKSLVKDGVVDLARAEELGVPIYVRS